MAPWSSLVLLPLLAAAAALTLRGGRRGGAVTGTAAAAGAGRGVDAGDPHIQGLGNWAVSKHDRVNGDRLVFQQVSRAEIQDVIGVDYRLHLKAAGGDAGRTSFVAVVWESAESGMRKLISFDTE